MMITSYRIPIPPGYVFGFELYTPKSDKDALETAIRCRFPKNQATVSIYRLNSPRIWRKWHQPPPIAKLLELNEHPGFQA